MRSWLRPHCSLGRRLVADTSGVAALEFAFIAGVLFMLLAGVVDLVDEVTRQREVDRVAVEVAEALGNCPDSDCVRRGVQDLIANRQVVLGSVPGGVLGTAEITRAAGRITVLQGSMTYLPTDVNREAMAVLADRDVGIAVLLTYDYSPIIGLFSRGNRTIRAYAVALRVKDVVMV